ncbi:hypothetical protein [Cryobacterium flavum]|nr:hypothetical protein [Cryobacterium flavum]
MKARVRAQVGSRALPSSAFSQLLITADAPTPLSARPAGPLT